MIHIKKMFASRDGHIKKLLRVLTQPMCEILQLPFDLDYVEFKLKKEYGRTARDNILLNVGILLLCSKEEV